MMASRVEHVFAWSKTRLAKPSMRPSLEGLENRLMPSASPLDSLAGNSPIMNGVTNQIAAATSLLQTARQMETQWLTTLSADVQTAYADWLAYAASANPMLATMWHSSNGGSTSPETSGSGLGSGTMSTGSEGTLIHSTGHTVPTQGARVATMFAGSGSGSGSGSGGSSGSSGSGTGSGSGSATVSGVVWFDSDGDGFLNNGESGVSGVTVSFETAQGTTLLSTTTNAGGNYQLNVSNSLLNQGSGSGTNGGYVIQVALPSGDKGTIENASGSGINSNINSSGYSVAFPLAQGGNNQINAGLVAGSGPATVTGEVWSDSNADGILDNGESGLSGVTVNLDNAQGQTLLTTTTNASGNYQFSASVGTGSGSGSNYEVQVVIPSNVVATLENVSGSGSGINSNINGYGYSKVFSLSPGGNQQVNAGLAPQPVVSGEVWDDSNGDGLLNNNESGMSGVVVNLDNAAGQVLMTTTTDVNGNYQLSVAQSVLNQGSGSGSGSASGGDYEIQVVFPNGDTATVENASGSGINSNIDASGYSNLFTLSPGGSQHVNAGLVAQSGSGGSAVVSGEVWLDNNGDGILDDGEMGFSGITVNLDSSTGQVLMTTTTDDDGDYEFTIPVGNGNGGTYQVSVVLPEGDEATYEGADSEIDANGLSFVFGLNAGGAQNVNAGIESMQVTTTEDDANRPIQNEITLRDAIRTGNNGPPAPAVTFQEGLRGVISLQAALDPIQKSFNIVGPGSSAIIVQGNGNANNSYRIFTIKAGVTTTISDLGITGGYIQNGDGGGILNQGNLTLLNDAVTLNQATNAGGGGGDGGGVCNTDDGTLEIENGYITRNTAREGGGLFNHTGIVTISSNSEFQFNNASSGGGGIYNWDGRIDAVDDTQILSNRDSFNGAGVVNVWGGAFLMDGGSISNNIEQSGGGGGVVNSGGTMTLSGVAVQGNQAKTQGGGIYAGPGTLTLTGGTTIVGPGTTFDAASGGGMFIKGGNVKMSGGTISKNVASSTPGGAMLTPGGGGIYVNSGILTLTNVIVKLNAAMGHGGGLLVNGGKVKVTGGTFTNNGVGAVSNGGGIYVNAGTLTLTKTKIVNNGTSRGAGGGNGGGMYINGGVVTISGGSIEKNKTTNQGGGIYINVAANLTLKNDVQIELNDASNQGGGMYLANGSTTTFIGTVNPWSPSCFISGNTIGGGLNFANGMGVYAQINSNWKVGWNTSVIDKQDPGGTPKTGA